MDYYIYDVAPRLGGGTNVHVNVANQQNRSGNPTDNEDSLAAHGIRTAKPQQIASKACGYANHLLADG